MDHRGTGRGTILKCENVSAPTGPRLSASSALYPSQVPACAKELAGKYGDLAAFSTTSAAMDLVTFISKYGSDFSTTIYGVGSGSVWAERVMHLDPPEVTGYVMDAVATTSGASLDKFYNVTSMDATGEVGDAILDQCAKDTECSRRFKKKGLKESVKHLITRFDNHPRSTCAKLVKGMKVSEDDDSPSFDLRFLLAGLMVDGRLRTLVAPTVYRLLRCAEKDVAVLTQLVQFFAPKPNAEDTSDVAVLESLIVMSEMWESPSPSAAELKARLQDVSVFDYAAYQDVPSYCAYSKEKSPTCNKLKVGNYEGNGIIYERDEFWNKAAKIPDQASVLLLSTTNDLFEPSKYAEILLETLVGDKKELVTFKHHTTNALSFPEATGAQCGATIVASFVHGEGDLTKLNKTCLEDEVPYNTTVPQEFTNLFFGTHDAYDGSYDPGLVSTETSASTSQDGSV